MKKYMPMGMLAMGILAGVLRSRAYRSAVDARGLLIPTHPLLLALWALALLALAASIWYARTVQTPEPLPDWMPAGGCFALAAGMALAMFQSGGNLIFRVLLPVGAVAIALVGSRLILGKRPVFGCHLALTACFAGYLVASYQLWSRDPQLMDYLFTLLGGVCLTLFAYEQAAGDLGKFSRKRMFFGMFGGFLCLASLPWKNWIFPAGALWMLTNLAVPTQEGN